jgi:hypothetical protein
MSIKPWEKYQPNAQIPTPQYPWGSLKNESNLGIGDGTPLDVDWGNDFEAFKQTSFDRSGLVPSGVADTVENSEMFNAMQDIVLRNIWERLVLEAGYTLATGSFEEGSTLNSNTECLWYKTENSVFNWIGAIPSGGKIVPPSSNPTITGGISPIGDWTDITDISIRDQLSSYLSDLGSSMVAFKQNLTNSSERNVYQKLSEIVSVDDFGPTGDVVGDSLAVTKAIAATPNGGAIKFSQNKIYTLNGVSLSGKTLTFLAHGATIKGPVGVRVPGYFDYSGAGDIKIVGATVDLMHNSIPQYTPSDYPNEYNRLFYGVGANSIVIESCNIKNLYNTVISSNQVALTKVINNSFYSNIQNQTQVLDYIRCTTSAELVVEGNEFNSALPSSPAYGTCAVFASGITKSATVRGNRFKNCGRDNTGTHRLGVIDFYFDVKNINVSDNISENGLAQFSRISSCATGKVSNNIIDVSGIAESQYTLISVESIKISNAGRACSDILIEGNTFNDPFNRHESHVGIYSYDWGLATKDIRIINNKFNGSKNIVYIIGPYEGITINDNMSNGYVGKVTVRSQGNQTLTSLDGIESNSAMSNLSICGNTLVDIGTAGIQIDFDTTKTPAYSGTVGDTSISGNSLINKAGAGVYGINFKGISNVSGRLRIKDNTIKGFSLSRRVQFIGALDDRHNTTFSGAGLDVSNTTSVFKRFNSDYGSSVSGIAKLVNGAVIVPSAEVKTTDLISLVNCGTNGTTGTLYINTKIQNTSFEIKSTSATDQSYVLWEIHHV